jgi:hypothetical protein
MKNKHQNKKYFWKRKPLSKIKMQNGPAGSVGQLMGWNKVPI